MASIKRYLVRKKSRSNFFVYHNVSKVFDKIETFLFVLLCLIFIVTSKINKPFTDNISMAIVDFSLPISQIISFPINKVVEIVINFQDLVNAKNYNKILIEENSKLKALYIKTLDIYQINKQLQKIVQYSNPRSVKYSVARLIAYPYQIYSNNIFVDIGSNQNVRQDDVVIGNNALIGRINQIDSNKSRVLLITDINSRVPVITSNSRVKGILAGSNSSTMDILYLEKNHKIAINDMVFTSGDGESMPSGLLVGIVTKVGKYSAKVKMIENIKNLDMVSIIEYN